VRKVTNEKPIKIPLKFEDTLKAFLETRPENRKAKRNPKKQKSRRILSGKNL